MKNNCFRYKKHIKQKIYLFLKIIYKCFKNILMRGIYINKKNNNIVVIPKNIIYLIKYREKQNI